MIFRSPSLEKLGRTSSMNTEHITRVAIFPTIVTFEYKRKLDKVDFEAQTYSMLNLQSIHYNNESINL